VIADRPWAAELLKLIELQAQPGETPPETVGRVILERDAFTAALALVKEQQRVLDNYRRALSNERGAKARENAAQDRRTRSEKASPHQMPHPTPFPPVFASSELPLSLTLFPRK
jgi:hypothetical protein